METKEKVETVKVDYKCPKCESGYLRPTGTCLPMNPPLYPHQCNANGCDYGETFTGKNISLCVL